MYSFFIKRNFFDDKTYPLEFFKSYDIIEKIKKLNLHKESQVIQALSKSAGCKTLCVTAYLNILNITNNMYPVGYTSIHNDTHIYISIVESVHVLIILSKKYYVDIFIFLLKNFWSKNIRISEESNKLIEKPLLFPNEIVTVNLPGLKENRVKVISNTKSTSIGAYREVGIVLRNCWK